MEGTVGGIPTAPRIDLSFFFDYFRTMDKTEEEQAKAIVQMAVKQAGGIARLSELTRIGVAPLAAYSTGVALVPDDILLVIADYLTRPVEA